MFSKPVSLKIYETHQIFIIIINNHSYMHIKFNIDVLYKDNNNNNEKNNKYMNSQKNKTIVFILHLLFNKTCPL